MSREKEKGKPAGTCAEGGCPNEGIRKVKTKDGFRIRLCEEHYKKWGRGEKNPKAKRKRFATIRNLFRRKEK